MHAHNTLTARILQAGRAPFRSRCPLLYFSQFCPGCFFYTTPTIPKHLHRGVPSMCPIFNIRYPVPNIYCFLRRVSLFRVFASDLSNSKLQIAPIDIDISNLCLVPISLSIYFPSLPLPSPSRLITTQPISRARRATSYHVHTQTAVRNASSAQLAFAPVYLFRLCAMAWISTYMSRPVWYNTLHDIFCTLSLLCLSL